MRRAVVRWGWLGLLLSLGLTGLAEAAPWSMFGGSSGRSSYAFGETQGPPLAVAWRATTAADQGVWTSPIVTQGARPLVAYGSQRPGWLRGPTSKGNVHLRDLATGRSVGPADGMNVDDGEGDSDTFGGGNKASVPFVDSSATGGPPGQLFVLHNDDGAGPGSDVAIAQIDEATGDLVREVAVPDTPHFAPGGAMARGQNGSDVSGSPVLHLDEAGNGVLVFRVGLPVYDPISGEIVRKIENVHVVPVRNARSRSAVIDVAGQRVTPDFQATSRTSPTLLTLADPTAGGSPATYIAMGTSAPGSTQYVKTFRLSDLAPGPTSAPLTGWGQTVAVPLTPSGLPPGAPGSGVASAPYLIVATGQGSTARVYKLQQQGDRLAVVDSVTLAGYPSPALAVAALAGPGAPPDGRIVVTTEHNLYVLRAGDLSVLATFSPTDLKRGCAPCETTRSPPRPSEAGFYTTTPLVAGRTIYVARDDGTQLVLDLETARPVGPDQFEQDAGNDGSTFTRGQPAVADGFAVFGSVNGVFAYRMRGGVPAPPPAPQPPGRGAPPPGDPPPPSSVKRPGTVAPPGTPPAPPDRRRSPRVGVLEVRAPVRSGLRAARRHGIAVRVRLGVPTAAAAPTVTARLLRPGRGARRLVALYRRGIRPTAGGRVVLRIRDLRALRPGRYVLDVIVRAGGRRIGGVGRRTLRVVR